MHLYTCDYGLPVHGMVDPHLMYHIYANSVGSYWYRRASGERCERELPIHHKIKRIDTKHAVRGCRRFALRKAQAATLAA